MSVIAAPQGLSESVAGSTQHNQTLQSTHPLSAASAVESVRNVECCNTFVASLRSRHADEDAGRKSRAQRRADVLNRTMQQCRKRDADGQRAVMQAKLGMISQVEHDLLQMLNEQSKWRHVMLENVVSREQQVKSVIQFQQSSEEEYWQQLQQNSLEESHITQRDDTKRFIEVKETDQRVNEKETWNFSKSVLSDCIGFAMEIVDVANSKSTNLFYQPPASVVVGPAGTPESRGSSPSRPHQHHHHSAAGGKATPAVIKAPSALDTVPVAVLTAMKMKSLPQYFGATDVVNKHVELTPLLVGTAPLDLPMPPRPITAITNSENGATPLIPQPPAGRPGGKDITVGRPATPSGPQAIPSAVGSPTVNGGAGAITAAPLSPLTNANVPLHNAIFCSLISNVVTAKFPPRAPFVPKLSTPKALILVMGPHLAGKQTICQGIAEQQGLKYITDTAMVEEALQNLERPIDPTVMLHDDLAMEFLDIGKEIRQSLAFNGGVVSDELLARLTLYFWNSLNADLLKQEAVATSGVSDTAAEVAAGEAASRAPQATGLMVVGLPPSVSLVEMLESKLSGYMQVDNKALRPKFTLAPLEFANPDEKALIVEKDDGKHKDAEGANANPGSLSGAPASAVASGVAAATAKKPDPKGKGKDAKGKGKGQEEAPEEPLPPVDLPHVDPVPPLSEEEKEVLDVAHPTTDIPAITKIIFFDVASVEETFCRFAGRRVDEETQQEYHVERNPPPLPRTPFAVTPQNRVDADCSELHLQALHFQKGQSKLEQWICQTYPQRGDEANRASSSTLFKKVNAIGPMEEVAQAVESIVAEAIDDAQAIYDIKKQARVIEQHHKDMEALYQKRVMNRDSIRKQLLQVYMDRGVEVIPAELLIDATGKRWVVAPSTVPGNPPTLVPAPAVPGGNDGSKEPSKEHVPLPSGVPEAVLSVMEKFSRHYESTVVVTLDEFVQLINKSFDQGKFVSTHCAQYWKQLRNPPGSAGAGEGASASGPPSLAFTSAPTSPGPAAPAPTTPAAGTALPTGTVSDAASAPTKQQLIDKLVYEMNTMTAVLRRDEQGKEELHLRAEALLESLHAITDKHSEESLQLIETMTNPSGFTEGWMDAVRHVGSVLIALELERFLIVKYLASMYFSSLKGEVYQVDESEWQNLETLLFVPKIPVEAAGGDASLSGGLSPSVAAGAKPGGKPSAPAPAADAKKPPAPPPKKGAAAQVVAPVRTADEERAAMMEEPLAGSLEKAHGVIKAAIEKCLAPPTLVAAPPPTQPGKKEAAGAKKPTAQEIAAQQEELKKQQAQIVTVGSLVGAVVIPEAECTKKRMMSISMTVRRLLEEYQYRFTALKSKLMHAHREHLYSEYEANASAVHYLRCKIEEETPIEVGVFLELESFEIDPSVKPKLVVAVPVTPRGEEPAAGPLKSAVTSPATAAPAKGGKQPAAAGSTAASPGPASSSGPPVPPVVSSLTSSLPVAMSPTYTAALAAYGDLEILTGVKFDRLLSIISLFKKVAPHHAIALADFRRIVKNSDWIFGTAASTPEGQQSVTTEVIFSRFDKYHLGLIDWREFMIHLLLWAEPVLSSMIHGVSHVDPAASMGNPFSGPGGQPNSKNPFYIEGPSLLQLYDVRDMLGSDWLDHDAFITSDFYFESQMSDDRAMALKELLWECFCVTPPAMTPVSSSANVSGAVPSYNGTTPIPAMAASPPHSTTGSPMVQPPGPGMVGAAPVSAGGEYRPGDENAPTFDGVTPYIDPNAFVLFLCADEQPLRGMQKAFAMAAEVGDESFSLSPERLYSVFHFHSATKTALSLLDPYSKEELSVLYTPGGPTTLTFHEVCGSVVGRVLLNSCKLFLKKKFTAA